ERGSERKISFSARAVAFAVKGTGATNSASRRATRARAARSPDRICRSPRPLRGATQRQYKAKETPDRVPPGVAWRSPCDTARGLQGSAARRSRQDSLQNMVLDEKQ